MIRMFSGESCGDCAAVKAALGQVLPRLGFVREFPADDLLDLPYSTDSILSAIEAAKGRLPLLVVGRYVFAIVGELSTEET